jgi:hypothetical protein
MHIAGAHHGPFHLRGAKLPVIGRFQELRGAKLLGIARLAGHDLVTVAACRTLAGPRS